MKNYQDLVYRILNEGERKTDRTGVGTIGVFGGRIEFDVRYRFPLVTMKETRWKVAFLEMLWFLRGERNTKFLHDHDCKLWDAWADEYGRVGRIYGYQWRNWDGEQIDQIKQLIVGIIQNPHGRRHIVSAWNVADVPYMSLPPCHWAFQCYVSTDGHLDMQVNQRSWDVALGAPFNIAQYALLLHLLARATGLTPRKLAFSYGDAHIYTNHIDAMRQVVELGPQWGDSAQLVIKTDNTDIDGYCIDDFEITGYSPRPFVKLEVAV